MAAANEVQFLLSYIHVDKSQTAVASAALQKFSTSIQSSYSADGNRVRSFALQRDGAFYSNQFALFLAANSTDLLNQVIAGAEYNALLAEIESVKIAPTVVKTFKWVSQAHSSHLDNVDSLLSQRNADAPFLFTVTHLDVIPSIVGNVDRAFGLLTGEGSSVIGSAAESGCIMFCALQQSDRANHFTFVQAWQSDAKKAAYDHAGAKAFKEQFFACGPLVGGCVWDEQFCRLLAE
jgi:hypothetical protein